MPAEPHVSVVIPTCGRPGQLRECLEALASQTMTAAAFEVVVVDDGSPEPLDALVAEFASRLQVRLLRQANTGPAAARNHGARAARAPRVAFTDDDCRPRPEWLERLLAAERRHPGTLVGGGIVNGLPDDVFATTSQLVVDLVYEHFNADPENAYFFASNNMLCDRERLLALGGFDTTFPRAGAEDRDFCDRWRAAGLRLVWQPAATIEHHHGQSLTKFIDLCYRYGRGARLYHEKRQSRGTGTMREDLGFHRSLPRRIWKRLGRPLGPWRSVQVCGTLLLWQFVNAVGFFVQGWTMDASADAANASGLPVHDIAALRESCRDHATRSTVTPAGDGGAEWVLDGGRLRHATADYFSIGLYDAGGSERLIMMEQQETALVMLLTATVGGVPSVLLNLRTEPGLIGLTNLSTTIQSTPSNYLRKHGGKPTSFLEIAADPTAFGTVLYDGAHHDWGDYYVAKTKRFLVVRLAEPVEAPSGFRWVRQADARRLLAEDHLITNDLRVTLTLLSERRGPDHGEFPTHDDAADAPAHLQALEFTPGTSDSRGTTVAFFRTQTETREVSSWVQPLLVPGAPMEIDLAFAERGGERVFAIERRTQPGLLGTRLWFPAPAAGGTVIRRVTTSAEGGRFWRFEIVVRVRRLDSPGKMPEDSQSRTRWITEAELADLVRQPLQTALELRMAWSLALAESAGDR